MALKYASSKYLDYSGALQVIGDIPLDIRNVVSVESDLITASTWYKNGSDSTTSIAYTGMLVSVAETGDVYICTNASAPTSLASWKKLASASDISGLSGVFAFKGLAEAVSPDLSYIVTCQGAEGDALSPIGTASDLEGDVYYGWQIGSKQIWTDSLVLNSASTQYTRGEGEVVKCVVYNDIYYFTTEQVTDDKTILESISGHQIKVHTTTLQTTDPAPVRIDVHDGEIVGDGYIIEYTAYPFTPIDNFATVDVQHAHTIIYASDGTKVVDDTTIPDNSGHVYQIGENEYASNGQIWVKLGSPVEDWIIL